VIRLKVKEVAQAKGMSQGRLQRRADVDVKTIRKIYQNPYVIINTDTLDKLAKALDVDVRELLESVPDE